MKIERIACGLRDICVPHRDELDDHHDQLAITRELTEQVPGLRTRLDAALEAYAADGAVILAETPVEQDSALLGLSACFGPVARLDNGPPPGHLIRDLTWSPTDGDKPALGLHTDSAYSPTPHGAIALACAENTEGGWGDTVLASIRDVSAMLTGGDRDTAARTPVMFTKMRAGRLEQQFAAPILDVAESAETCRFNQEHLFSGAELGTPIPGVVAGIVERIADLLEHGSITIRLKLRPGDLLVINNRRVLHGRTGLGGDAPRRMRRLKMMANTRTETAA